MGGGKENGSIFVIILAGFLPSKNAFVIQVMGKLKTLTEIFF